MVVPLSKFAVLRRFQIVKAGKSPLAAAKTAYRA